MAEAMTSAASAPIWPTSAVPGERAGGENEDRVAVDGRVDREQMAARSRRAPFARSCFACGLGQPRVGGDDAEGGVLRRRRRTDGARTQHRARVGECLCRSAARTPATTFPEAGSMTSPTALTATSAPTTTPFGSVSAAAADAALHRARSRRRPCRSWRRRRRRRCPHAPAPSLPPVAAL